jgi:16S rRNA processing protein RimM
VSNPTDDLVAVGRIGPARGVHGDVFVEPWTDAPDERFAPGAALYTEPPERGPLRVAASSRASGKQVVRFDGVEDRPGAEALRGVRLFVAAAERPPLDDPDEFYDSELIGLAARTTDGTDLGPVGDVTHAAGSSYLVVRVDGREHLIPFVRAIVPSVDLAARTVVVDPPDGLFEL